MLSEIYQSVSTCSPVIIVTNVLPRFIFLEVEPAKHMLLKQRATDHVQELTHLIKSALGGVESRMPFAGLLDTLSGLFGYGAKNHNEIVKRLFDFGCSTEQVVNSILALLVGATVEMSLGMFFLSLLMETILSNVNIIAMTNVVNQLLSSDIQSVKSLDAKGLSSLTAYVIEALSTWSVLASMPL